jgi:hypothetical protein
MEAWGRDGKLVDAVETVGFVLGLDTKKGFREVSRELVWCKHKKTFFRKLRISSSFSRKFALSFNDNKSNTELEIVQKRR